jgi:hypothetical protein
MAEQRLFDLNIEKILEAWDNGHAVRELIANALDDDMRSALAAGDGVRKPANGSLEADAAELCLVDRIDEEPSGLI